NSLVKLLPQIGSLLILDELYKDLNDPNLPPIAPSDANAAMAAFATYNYDQETEQITWNVDDFLFTANLLLDSDRKTAFEQLSYLGEYASLIASHNSAGDEEAHITAVRNAIAQNVEVLKDNTEFFVAAMIEKDVAFVEGTEAADNITAAARSYIFGDLSDDNITGSSDKDYLEGGGGEDDLNGAGGSDTYIYSRGDGNDTITETHNNGSADRLVFADINPADVSLIRNELDVTIAVSESAPGAGDGGSVLLKEHLDGTFDRGVEQVEFADG
ncbi:MAG: hypothetical protein GY807_10745, partial [Gammaproteobacteria bacterium]|nr:hypothetical protein [Gammaproteobacteria bacterium]